MTKDHLTHGYTDD